MMTTDEVAAAIAAARAHQLLDAADKCAMDHLEHWPSQCPQIKKMTKKDV